MDRAADGLLVTDYVNPELAEMMRNQGIFFIDAAGNAFVNATPLYIFVKDEKPNKIVRAKPVKRLFKPGGLKLIFALLNNPELEKATYRDMAKAANVALGTVDFVITELKELGFIIDMAKKGYVPPLLIYADLMATGDARAIEAAEVIYDKYLARLIREDR